MSKKRSKEIADERPDRTVFSDGLPITDEFRAAWLKAAERRELGRTLEKMRREKGYTQAELAARMQKDQAFVARMESGRGNMPKAENIALYARSCGYETAYAFVASSDDKLTLHELQPIGASRLADALDTLRDLELPLAGGDEG